MVGPTPTSQTHQWKKKNHKTYSASILEVCPNTGEAFRSYVAGGKKINFSRQSVSSKYILAIIVKIVVSFEYNLSNLLKYDSLLFFSLRELRNGKYEKNPFEWAILDNCTIKTFFCRAT